jgi:serine/threonine protein kinase/WD40 repeat protein
MNRDEDVFADALALPPAERAAFLDRACAGDPAQRARLEELLAGVTEGARLRPAAPTAMLPPRPEEKPGDQIGSYKLLERIGVGGCGVVWLAEQGEPLRRRVAVKVIKLGMDTNEVIARFDAERHALALMDHPHIAQVFDAGASATGRPFFAMELVRGRPITEFCDANNLPTPARLGLFVQVCRAIQHAHLKGVIHRDIKPSNILVSFHDGVAVPKVIDFGIAKATTGRLTDHTLYTSVEQMIGTPLYMSPEQIELGGQDVDTRSDVYSLGVLLYELLAGRPPFDPKTLAESGLEGLRRVIREMDPEKPSTRLGTLGQADRDTIARQRGTNPKHLVRQLRGDLDWIVMRCLEKNRARRYETASELARDVEKHLHNEPVTARPPSTLYRLVKLAARHKVATASLATAAVILIAVAASATAIAVRARRAELAEAQQSSRTDVTLGSRMIAEGSISEGLAFLVRAAQSDPDNYGIAPRLLSVLANRSFPRPIGKPLPFIGIASDAAYSADGKRVTVVTKGNRWVWDLTDGRSRRYPDTNPVSRQSDIVGNFTSDLRRMALGGASGRITVLDSESGQELVAPLFHESRINNVLFSPDDRWLATTAHQGSVKLWNPATGELKFSVDLGLPPREEFIMPGGVVFSRGGTRLLVTTSGTRWGIWTVPGGERAVPLQRSSTVRFTGRGAFSPDDKLVAIADTKGAQLYDAASGAPFGPHLDHDSKCGGVVFSRDGNRLVTLSDDQNAKVWLISSLAAPQFVWRHSGPVGDGFFTMGDGHLVTLGGDGLTRMWNLTSGELTVATGHQAQVGSFIAAKDGSEFLTFDRFDSVARRWRAPANPLSPRRLPADADRKTVRMASGGREAHAIYSNRVQTLSLPSLIPKESPRMFPPNATPNWSLVTFEGLDLFAIFKLGHWELWNLRESPVARHRLSPTDPTQLIIQVWWKPGAQRFVTQHRDEKEERWGLDIWDLSSGARAGPTIRLPYSLANTLSTLDLTPDERLVAAGVSGHGVELWDVATGKKIGDPFVVPPPVRAVRFSPDGRWLALCGGDSSVQLWDVMTRQPVGAPLLHPTLMKALEFSEDSRRLITFTAAEVRLWEVLSGAPLTVPMRPRLAPGDEIAAAILRQNDRLIVAASARGLVHVYASATGQLLLEPFPARKPGFYGLEATDRYVAITSTSGSNPSFTPELAVWPLPPLDLRVPVPGWLLRLATATAGGTVDRFAAFREQPADEETFDAIRAELAALPVNAPYADWGRWLLADPATRPPAPAFK